MTLTDFQSRTTLVSCKYHHCHSLGAMLHRFSQQSISTAFVYPRTGKEACQTSVNGGQEMQARRSYI